MEKKETAEKRLNNLMFILQFLGGMGFVVWSFFGLMMLMIMSGAIPEYDTSLITNLAATLVHKPVILAISLLFIIIAIIATKKKKGMSEIEEKLYEIAYKFFSDKN